MAKAIKGRHSALILQPYAAHPRKGADMTRDQLPTGVVTFLMSDVEGSGEHWASDPHQMTIAVRDLDSVVANVSETHRRRGPEVARGGRQSLRRLRAAFRGGGGGL